MGCKPRLWETSQSVLWGSQGRLDPRLSSLEDSVVLLPASVRARRSGPIDLFYFHFCRSLRSRLVYPPACLASLVCPSVSLPACLADLVRLSAGSFCRFCLLLALSASLSVWGKRSCLLCFVNVFMFLFEFCPVHHRPEEAAPRLGSHRPGG